MFFKVNISRYLKVLINLFIIVFFLALGFNHFRSNGLIKNQGTDRSVCIIQEYDSRMNIDVQMFLLRRLYPLNH